MRNSLCYRCEHRARFLETGMHRPRFECGDVNKSKHACYMYLPVAPVMLKRVKGDKRPLTLNALSCRVEAAGVPPVDYKLVNINKNKVVVYCDVNIKELGVK